MDPVRSESGPDPPLKRFKLAVQKNRALLFGFGCLLAIVLGQIGVFQIGLLSILLILAVAEASAVLIYLAYRKWWRLNLDPLWFLIDAGLATWGVALTGGAHSPWFPWYLANVSGAAVVSGLGWAVAMAVIDTIAYIGVLMAMGEIGWLDGRFFEKLGIMLSLFTASFFFLWGMVELQKKRRVIKHMKENEHRKVLELTRLTQELDQKTREIAEANVKIQQADRLKSQFLANMSHELRTPLNSIIGFSDVLLTRLENGLPERYARFLQNINTSGHHLLGIINDLLDLSKIEAGKMEVMPERFSLESLLHGVCTVMRGMADKKGIGFTVRCGPDLPPLEADPIKIKQVFYNLLSNAVKFSPDGSEIALEARRLGERESPLGRESIAVAVMDRGVGIDAAHYDTIFEEFHQLDSSSSRSFRGTGLGLAIVKRFVALHHGSIRVESTPGLGSTFTVALPVQFQGERTEAPELLESFLPENVPRILIVEDDPTAFEALKRHLGSGGYAAARARLGQEALDMAREIGPSAITLDLILPDMDGWEVLRRLKEAPETRDIPVIIVSIMENRELGMALGAVDYFLKPVDGGALISRLNQILPRGNLEGDRLLLVDDDRGLHDMLDYLLVPEGFQVLHAFSGEEGLAMAASQPVSLMILDLMMEKVDGFEVAARLAARPETKDIPVLVLTSKILSADDQRRLSGRIQSLMQKGDASPTLLVETIRRLLQRHEGRPRP